MSHRAPSYLPTAVLLASASALLSASLPRSFLPVLLVQMDLGSLVRVWYSDDNVWHERVVLLRGMGPNMFWVVTPDMDVYEEDLGGNAENGPHRVCVGVYGRSRLLHRGEDQEGLEGT